MTSPVQPAPESPFFARPAKAAQPRECLECGKPYASHRAEQVYCSEACNTRFNNRLKDRGPAVYQLLMAIRFERSLAAKLKLWSRLCALCSDYREQDLKERAGRHSWRHPLFVLARVSHIFSKRIG